MNDEDPTLIVLTDEDMAAIYDRIMSSVPYDTPGQLRDAVFNGGPLCCPACFDWQHEHVRAWQELENWLFLVGQDWREVE